MAPIVTRSVSEEAATPEQRAKPGDYLVFYDTLCPICRRSRRALERWDWRSRLVFRDIHDREQMEREAPGVSYQHAMREMIVRTPSGQILGGFDAFRAIAWALPILWLAIPFLYLPGVGWLGRRVYRWIARNRYRLVACENDICSLHLRALSKPDLDEAEIATIVEKAKREVRGEG